MTSKKVVSEYQPVATEFVCYVYCRVSYRGGWEETGISHLPKDLSFAHVQN